MLRLFKKTLAVCLIGFGLGLLLVILLPFSGWLFIIGIALISIKTKELFQDENNIRIEYELERMGYRYSIEVEE